MNHLPDVGKMVRMGALCIFCTLLAGCATAPEPRIITREVKVPVAVACAADPGPAPAYADSDAALLQAPDLFARVRLLMAGRAQRIAREIELLAANSGCR